MCFTEISFVFYICHTFQFEVSYQWPHVATGYYFKQPRSTDFFGTRD